MFCCCRNLIKNNRFAKYFSFLKEVKLPFILAIVSGAIYGVFSGFGIPIMLKFAADSIFSDEVLPFFVIVIASLGPFIVMCFRAVLEVSNTYLIGLCGQKILEKIRVLIFSKLQRLPIEYFRKTEPGQILARNFNDTSILQQTILEVSQEIIKQPITLIGALAAIIYLCLQQSDIAILLIFLVAVPVVIWPVKIIGNRLKRKSSQLQKDNENLTTMLSYNLSSAQEIRAFCRQQQEIDCYSVLCQKLTKSVLAALKYSVLSSPLVEIVSAGGVGVAMYYCYQAGIGAASFLALSGALYFSYDPVKRIARLNNSIKSGAASLERIEELLNEKETISDPIVPVIVDKLIGDIRLKNIYFSYDKANDVLKNINEEFEHGKVYALVGNSGGGKSTTTNMILRFYDVDSGNVMIDGIDVKNMKLDDLRRNIAFVPQSPVLVNGTILDNILWGKPSASEEEVVVAAKNAYAHDFIMSLPDAYNTIVGEGGACISGGQKQRIAIARAFLKNAPILILDEATSALDTNSEHEIHKAIEILVKNKTAILISHRFTMMSIVDKVLVINNGQVIESGSPEELFANKNSMYFSLSSKQ